MAHYERTGRTLAYSGKVLKVYQDEITFQNGSKALWDFVDHKGGACAVAVLPNGNVLMVRQFRNAFSEEILELPAGGVEEGEDRRICALRELSEEAGYRAQTIQKLCEVRTNVAISGEVIHVYLCTDLVKTSQHLDTEEDIQVLEYPIEELFQMVLDGRVTDAKTIAGITTYYGLLKNGGLEHLPKLNAEYE